MATPLMYKGISQRSQRRRDKRTTTLAPRGSAEWMRQQQAIRNRPKASAEERALRERLDDEARVNQAQRAINREGLPPSQDARAVSIPSPAGLRRSPRNDGDVAK